MKVFLISLLILSSISGYSPNIPKEQREFKFKQVQQQIIKQERVQYIKNSDFKVNLMLEYIQLVYPNLNDVAIKQFILETSWFKSKIFLENNNICGMKLPKVRETTAIGERYNHAMYDHYTNSIDDYMLWYQYNSKHYIEDYYSFLNNVGYAEADGYIKILKEINLENLNKKC